MTKTLKYITCVTIAVVCTVVLGIAGTFLYLAPKLPNVDILPDIKLQIPLRIYTNDEKLIAEFGNKRRSPIDIEDTPKILIDAFLAAEDDRFYEHNGVSLNGLGRAIYQALSGASRRSGGSTITQQVAKNYFLTPEKTVIRKLREIFLALQMERSLSKDQILELYLNKIFLGHRAYGVAAAAQVYYGKSVDELSPAEAAMIAGLPKAPSAYNPLANPQRALKRRDWILGRMHSLGYINTADYQTAVNAPLTATRHSVDIEVYAPYVAEMARQKAEDLIGEAFIYDGYKVYTTINSRIQETAHRAAIKGTQAYDSRHGYRKPEKHLKDLNDETKKTYFATAQTIAGNVPVIVVKVNEESIVVENSSGASITIGWQNGLSDKRRYLSASRRSALPKKAADIVKIGDVVRIRKNTDNQWILTQVPDIETALVSMDPFDGAILALIGGYDFYKSKFNRATQAERQMGSAMKPFVYASAINSGLTPATIINDAPVVFEDSQLENIWTPSNDDGKFLGPTRLREGLYRSRNLVSIRVLRKVGINRARNYLSRFGFGIDKLPKDLSLALGSASFTPLQVATAYSTFANQGFKVNSYMIDRITLEDNAVYQALPALACEDCLDDANQNSAANDFTSAFKDDLEVLNREQATESDHNYAQRIMSEQDVFLMDSILRDVTQKGTGWRAGRALKRNDIGGKTGTTNGPTDAWFAGYQKNIVTVAWVGFDNNSFLGRGEYGGTAALPMWIDIMKVALKGTPLNHLTPPPGIVSVLIDKKTGKRALPGQTDTTFEFFKAGQVPETPTNQQTPESQSVNLEEIF
ncbi:Penicillin-binding protein 1A [BD1-7 clade bacterium]|uniref:Penicillin-binding protein 1A n=1 Tax=BD1-7 clade bacterium TaxID=2029982 RepID=A0A5S9Q9Q0_9GAMM|nr:Penicillin-binding protein 1A [BD1-7 clade bacterium]